MTFRSGIYRRGPHLCQSFTRMTFWMFQLVLVRQLPPVNVVWVTSSHLRGLVYVALYTWFGSQAHTCVALSTLLCTRGLGHKLTPALRGLVYVALYTWFGSQAHTCTAWPCLRCFVHVVWVTSSHLRGLVYVALGSRVSRVGFGV